MVCEFRKLRQSRHVRVSLRPDGTVLVTLPWRLSLAAAESFLHQSLPWVRAQLQKVQATTVAVWPPYHAVKARAKVKIMERLKFFNQHYNYTYRAVSIRKQTSRWGSCSSQGNLNFNYRLYALDERLLDYVVVHELCHLREHNHSERFWRLVAETMPHHRALRQELRRVRM